MCLAKLSDNNCSSVRQEKKTDTSVDMKLLGVAIIKVYNNYILASQIYIIWIYTSKEQIQMEAFNKCKL